MLKAEIYITLKKTVSDPQGLTIRHALESLGYNKLEEVRMGKLIIITLKEEDKEKASLEVKEMCRRLLANPVIEDYSFQIKEI